MITACENDFALVGTAALFLTNVDDEVNCKDQAGAATGLPDISAGITGVPEACSPVSFPIFPPQLVCSTKDQHPQVYIGNQGGEKYLLKRHENDLHGPMIVAHDTMAAQLTGQTLTAVASGAGITADQNVTRSARDPQSAYTAIINQMKIDNSNYAFSAVGVNGAIALRSEAQVQGLNDPHIVWECPIGCYDKALKANASVMDGEYIAMNFLPFEEASSNATLQKLPQTRWEGQGERILGLRLVRWPRVCSGGEGDCGQGRRERVDSALVPPRGDPDAHEVRRRRHARHGEHRGQGADAVLCTRPAS